MPFGPEKYELVVPFVGRKNGVPSFGDGRRTLYWSSKSNPGKFTIKRIDIVGCDEAALLAPWTSSSRLIYSRRTQCTGAGGEFYAVDLAFNGKVLDDALAKPRANPAVYNLAHAFFNNELLRFEIQTECGARAGFFLKLDYVTSC